MAVHLPQQALELKKQFEDSLGIQIADGEWLVFLFVYPSFMVAIAEDGLQEEESRLMRNLLRNLLSEIMSPESTLSEVDKEINDILVWLLFASEHSDVWKQSLLLCWNDWEEPVGSEIKQQIYRLVMDMALAWEGISEKEQQVLDDILPYFEVYHEEE